MEAPFSNEPELNEPREMPEIDDLIAEKKNLLLQIDYLKQNNRMLRAQLTRANNVLGIEDWERAA